MSICFCCFRSPDVNCRFIQSLGTNVRIRWVCSLIILCECHQLTCHPDASVPLVWHVIIIIMVSYLKRWWDWISHAQVGMLPTNTLCTPRPEQICYKVCTAKVHFSLRFVLQWQVLSCWPCLLWTLLWPPCWNYWCRALTASKYPLGGIVSQFRTPRFHEAFIVCLKHSISVSPKHSAIIFFLLNFIF